MHFRETLIIIKSQMLQAYGDEKSRDRKSSISKEFLCNSLTIYTTVLTSFSYNEHGWIIFQML